MWGKVWYAVTASACRSMRRVKVGVQVEGQHDPAAVAEIGAHLFEEVPLGIVLAVGGRGSVQVEDEDVERHGGGDPVEQGAADLAKAGGAQASGGRAAEGGETGGWFPSRLRVSTFRLPCICESVSAAQVRTWASSSRKTPPFLKRSISA